MNRQAKIILFIVIILLISVGLIMPSKGQPFLYNVRGSSDVIQLFAYTPDEISNMTHQVIDQARQTIDEIVHLDAVKRTFANTAKKLDDVDSLSNFAIFSNIVQILEMVSPDETVKKAAHQAVIDMQNFYIDHVANNNDLYHAFKQYVDGNAKKESLTDEQRYYLVETIQGFKRTGMDLPPADLQEVKKIKKELAALELQFETNIATDTKKVHVAFDELKGVNQAFIDHVPKTEDGQYQLGLDYPTVFTIAENCCVESTRKKMSVAFQNRAYPANEDILKAVIEKRDQLAKKLGYESYAELDLADQMVGSVDRAEQFLYNLKSKAHQKEKIEFEVIAKNLPADVALSSSGKMNPWNMAYVYNHYKKNQYTIDEQEIAEYFPAQATIEKLLHIYEQFLSLHFKQVPLNTVNGSETQDTKSIERVSFDAKAQRGIGKVAPWHPEVILIEAYDKESHVLLGYLLLDLYPRDGKFTHACHVTCIPSTYKDSVAIPAVSIVIANFPKATADRPSLLKRSDVSTFFHEFGHAMHALLGRTQIGSFSGTRVKRDFVELPSQMLEEWLWDKDILKSISSHYKTGQALPDTIINNILALKNLTSGQFIGTQLWYAKLSLDYFKAGAVKDPYHILQKTHLDCRHCVEFMPEDRKYASFGHLMGYGAKYYGYLWSKVFALDMFAQIKKAGLLNPEMGKKYIAAVIGKGGSQDPNTLLKDFLGREPNQEAFLKDLGL